MGTKKGVYHIVITISDITSIVGRTAGNLINESSKILVVTLKSSENVVTKLQNNSLKLLKNTTDRIKNTIKINGKNGKKTKRRKRRRN